MLCSIVNFWRNGVRVTLYGGAGRQHGACSETFWASCIMLFVFPGKDGRVTGRTESLPESQMDYTLFQRAPPPPRFHAIWGKQPASLMWPFPVCGVRTKTLRFLSMPELVFFSFFLPTLSSLSLADPSTFLLSPSFNDLFFQECLTWAGTGSAASLQKTVNYSHCRHWQWHKKTGCFRIAALFIIPLISFWAAR